MHLTCRNVKVAESKQALAEQHDILYSKAREFFERAKELLSQTQDSVLLREVYGKIAQMLEQSGQPQEDLSYWKTAYESLSNPNGQSLEWLQVMQADALLEFNSNIVGIAFSRGNIQHELLPFSISHLIF